MKLDQGGRGVVLYLKSKLWAGRIWYRHCNYNFNSLEGNINIVKPLGNISIISTAVYYRPNELTICEEVTGKQSTSISLYAYEYGLKPEMA